MKALTMQKIVIIGAGRVAVNLSNSIQRKGYQIIEVCNRSESAGRYLAVKLNAKYVRKPERVSPDAGLYIIAVSDSAIPSIAERLRTGDHMVVHTSGSADMEVLEGASSNYGVIYPLQTFTFRRMLTLRDVPLCISANSMENIVRLKSFAYSLSNNVNIVTTEQRRALHLAAVYANNFANFMVTVAQDLLLDNGIDPGMLVPLIKQTAFNTAAGYAFKMQTGPAIREDMDTLSLHLDMLSSHPEYREIYELITKNIIQHKKEL